MTVMGWAGRSWKLVQSCASDGHESRIPPPVCPHWHWPWPWPAHPSSQAALWGGSNSIAAQLADSSGGQFTLANVTAKSRPSVVTTQQTDIRAATKSCDPSTWEAAVFAALEANLTAPVHTEFDVMCVRAKWRGRGLGAWGGRGGTVHGCNGGRVLPAKPPASGSRCGSQWDLGVCWYCGHPPAYESVRPHGRV
jgi:hypothetical protein